VSLPEVPEVPEGVDLALLEEIACTAARSAGALVRDERPGDLDVDVKSTRTDVVTEMDRRSQEHLITTLTRVRPDDAVFGEEEGAAAGRSGITWVVDPIDGTVNYLYRIPSYAVSVAAVVGDPTVPGAWRSLAGAVLNPETDELFHARLGGGARLTHRGRTGDLRASMPTDLAVALVGTGFSYAAQRRAQQARLLVELLPRVRDIRRAGSSALDLCAVGAGRLDAYYETALNAWDHAAGHLVATEAGAVVGGPDGEHLTPELAWACSPTLAGEFPALVRSLTATYLRATD
jgi:myo-inositol-1(or 4)-monophosphatase